MEYEYPGARWEATTAVAALVTTGSRIGSAIATCARRHGLTHAALNALAIIEGSGGPIPTGEVGNRMHVTTGTMTSVLDTLERNGHIVRLADPDDRRRVLVDITPTAQEILDQLLPVVQQLARTLVVDLDDHDLVALKSALATIQQSLDQLPDEPPAASPRRRPTDLDRS